MNSEEINYTIFSVKENEIQISVLENSEKIIFNKKIEFRENYEDFLNNNINFFEQSIKELEKKIGYLLKSVNIILPQKNFLEINLSIKENVRDGIVSKKNIENVLFNLKNQISENNQNYYINNIRINHFKVADIIYDNFNSIPGCKDYIIDITFSCLPDKLKNFYKTFFLNFEMTVSKIFSTNNLSLYEDDNSPDHTLSAAKLLHDGHANDVYLVEKDNDKKGFFENLFNLIS